MKKRPTFKAHAKTRRQRRKLLNLTGTGETRKQLGAKSAVDRAIEVYEKTADDRFKTFGRALLNLRRDQTPKQLWQQQIQMLADQLAEEQGIPPEHAKRLALNQLVSQGHTPATFHQLQQDTDVRARSALRDVASGLTNPLVGPIAEPGFALADAAIEAGQGEEPSLAQTGAVFGGAWAGERLLSKLLGQRAAGLALRGLPLSASAKFLGPAYSGLRTALDPTGVAGLAELGMTGSAGEYERTRDAQAMRNVLQGQKIDDSPSLSRMPEQLWQTAATGLVPHLGDFPGLGEHLQGQRAKFQQGVDRSMIRGDLLSGNPLLDNPLTLPGLISQGGRFISRNIGDVEGYDPFYRERWQSRRHVRRLDEQQRQNLRRFIRSAGQADTPEGEANRLWLSQMKRAPELSPFGSRGRWTQDLMAPSYKPTDEAQTSVDPSQTVWQRALADARQQAEATGMSLSDVLAGSDLRTQAQDRQAASQLLAKAQAIQRGETQGMTPQEVAEISGWMQQTQARGAPIDLEAATAYTGGQRRAQQMAQAKARGGQLSDQDVGRHGGYAWWRSQLAEGKGYSPYESLSARARAGTGFDRKLFDELYTPEVLDQIKQTRGYQHAQSGIRGAFSQAQLEQFLADKSPYELEKLYGAGARTLRELHRVGRPAAAEFQSLANRMSARETGPMTGNYTGFKPPEIEKPKPQSGTGNTVYKSRPKKKNVDITPVPQNASGMGSGSRV